MSHFAKIENNLVTNVIVAEQEFIDTQDGTWVQTSYNTRGNVHYGQDGKPDGGTALRANYAGIGDTYTCTTEKISQLDSSKKITTDFKSITFSLKIEKLKKKNFLAKSLQQKLYQQKVVPNKKTYNRKKQTSVIK